MPSHNCIIIFNVQFSRYNFESQEIQWNLNLSVETSVNLLKKWWRLAGSNRWPPACKAGALPAELNPHIINLYTNWKPNEVGFNWKGQADLRSSIELSVQCDLRKTSLDAVVGQGLAFLRKSHGGYNSPPDCCQEPPFESILAWSPQELNLLSLDSYFSFSKSGGPKWTRTIDLTIISRVL